MTCASMASADNWPDGTKIDKWFADTSKVDVKSLGRQYVITDYGVKDDSTIVQTMQLQAVIDKAAKDGGGVIVIPRGTFLSGSLFFKPKTHLHIAEGGKLKGSDRITNYKIVETRIEGETCMYFSALVNADHVDGFTITARAPSTATDTTTGTSSGYAGSGTASATTRTHSGHDSSTSPTPATSRCRMSTS